MNRWSQIAMVTSAISTIVASSPVRRSGIVATATPPALTRPNQLATNHGLLGPRRSTRFPGTSPISSTSAQAIWFAFVSRSLYVQVSLSVTMQRFSPLPASICRSRSPAAQFSVEG